MIKKIEKNFLFNRHFLFIVTFACFLDIVIELLGRDTPLSLVKHIVFYPVFFIYNILIISFFLSFSNFFKRKKFATFVISLVWLSLGIANFVVLSYRITPFAFIDLMILEPNLDFLGSYLNIALILGLTIVISAMIISVIIFFKKSTKTQVQLTGTILTSFTLFALIAIFYQSFLSLGVFETRISNMSIDYEKFGFVSCFTRSAVERGIDEPDNYSENAIDKIVLSVEDSETSQSPNVIIVQLESFFDPNLIADTYYTENPIPYFTSLMEDYSSGNLEVAVVGAGTANTEFEVLTGMSVDFFGTGEYPYETVLQDSTCESIAYNLKKLGYTSFAIHNNTGTFYQRNEVYPNLGFDYFISSEFMADTTTTPNDWIKDKHLTTEIFKCLNSSDGEDFVFAVSVQGHGSFPEEETANLGIRVTDSPFDEGLENQIEYYVNQLYEMDLFIKELTEELSSFDEPVILALYGDHIPSLNLEADDLVTGDNYETQYVIWSNFELSEKDKDLATYQLSATVLDEIGINNGAVTKLHQEYSEDEDYLETLEMLQYDILYGDNFSYDGVDFQSVDMQMGVEDISIETDFIGEYLCVSSPDLTDSSVVYVNDKKVEAIKTEDDEIYISAEKIEDGDTVCVKQVSPDNSILYESKSVVIT